MPRRKQALELAQIDATLARTPPPEPTSAYHLVCLACSRSSAELRMTALTAHRRMLAGLPRCATCGGSCYLDVAEAVSVRDRVRWGTA